MSALFGVAPVLFLFDDVPEYLTHNIDKILITHYGECFKDFIENVMKLNDEGLKLVRTYADDLSQLDKYKKEEPSQ